MPFCLSKLILSFDAILFMPGCKRTFPLCADNSQQLSRVYPELRRPWERAQLSLLPAQAACHHCRTINCSNKIYYYIFPRCGGEILPSVHGALDLVPNAVYNGCSSVSSDPSTQEVDARGSKV